MIGTHECFLNSLLPLHAYANPMTAPPESNITFGTSEPGGSTVSNNLPSTAATHARVGRGHGPGADFSTSDIQQETLHALHVPFVLCPTVKLSASFRQRSHRRMMHTAVQFASPEFMQATADFRSILIYDSPPSSTLRSLPPVATRLPLATP